MQTMQMVLAPDEGYVFDATLEEGDVQVTLTHLDEGFDGEYNPDDPDDRPLYRYDVQVKGPPAENYGLGLDDRGDGWCTADSWCTHEPLTPDRLRVAILLHRIMALVQDAIRREGSLKEIGLYALDTLRPNGPLPPPPPNYAS